MKATVSSSICFLFGAAAIALIILLNKNHTKSAPLDPAVVANSAQPKASIVPSAPPTFVTVTNNWTWGDLSSSEYDEYIEKLRAVNCPELTITSMVIGDVNRSIRVVLKERRAHFVATNSYVPGYWNSTVSGRGKKIAVGWQKIEQETNGQRLGIIRKYARTSLPPEALYPVKIGVNDEDLEELALDFISEEKREAVREKLKQSHLIGYQLQQKGLSGDALVKAYVDSFDTIYTELSASLLPEEINGVKLRTSLLATQLKQQLGYFEPTENEFKAIYKAYDDARKATDDSILAEELAKQKLKSELDGDRLSEFNRTKSNVYGGIAQYAEFAGIEQSEVNQLYNIYREAANSTDNGANQISPNMLEIERSKIRLLLGQKADAFLQSEVGNWLNSGIIRPDSSVQSVGLLFSPP